MAEGGAEAWIDNWTRELSERLAAALAPAAAAVQPAALAAGVARVYWGWPGSGEAAWTGRGGTALAAATVLEAEAVAAGCEAAARGGAVAIEVAPCHLAAAVAQLRNTPVRVGVAVGGEGLELTTVKMRATSEALKLGADEIVWIPNAAAVRAGAVAALADELRAAAQLCGEAGAGLLLGVGAEGASTAALLGAARAQGVAWLRLFPGAGWQPPLPAAGLLMELPQ
ncbi:MAG: hypothetical protein ACRD2H_10385 [Terriglobales bacterium]